MSSVRVRMAPSPTGWIHVGTARTYLMAQLFALQQKGALILRIEDTDDKRSVPGGIQGIIESLELLGIHATEGPGYGGDVGPYIQMQRLDIYKKYAEQLITDGHAYRCFCTEERLEKLKEEQTANKEKRRYDGLCSRLSESEIAEKMNAGIPYVIRMKVPKNEKLEFTDGVLGKLMFDTNDVNDQVLLKSSGIPTYHLAVVVDDHLMEVTHVHRGFEWLSSTPKQILLYKYFGWKMPPFYHVPLLLNETGKGKLSKRKGDVAVIDFFRKGYIHEGFVNYLMLVGWSPDPKVAHADEIYSFDFFVQHFDHARIKRSSGRFQVDKMTAINSQWIARLGLDDLLARFATWFDAVLKDTVVDSMRGITETLLEQRKKAGELREFFAKDPARARRLLEIIQTRMKLLPDAYDWLSVLWNNTYEYDTEAIEKVIPEIEKRNKIAYNLREALLQLDSWDQEPWEHAIRSLADSYGLKHGDLFMILRVIVTGKKISPPLREFMEIAGREFVSKRFEHFVQ